ncbi:MAG: hypothetical protein A2161_12360 [Candidatus Schekmanbacteria bacterium RBG_13_48_7]|uniref:Uncharacterized protein n=1 Tax=Candidatus Schekmanbacteria bacterium RBG_13_48_7 TaxID=1817878 RepID=A0A1F7RMB4_9BACT|nr:MAG: hypothetical protein A2161_12360 [Candidatus Schekmanbacteria bacterium RBG_13_48_7]
MLARKLHNHTISRREVAKRLNISLRQLTILERQTNIIPMNDHMFLLKKQYTFNDFNQIKKVINIENKPIPKLSTILIVVVVFAVSFVFTGMLRSQGKFEKNPSAVTMEIPPDAKIDQGVNMLRRGKIAEARAAFQSSMTCGVSNIEQRAAYQYIESFKDDSELYPQMLEKFVSDFPGNRYTGDVLFSLANFYNQQNLVKQALIYYSQLVNEYPNHIHMPNATVQIIRIETMLNMYTDAVKTANEFIQKYPKNVYAPKIIYAAASLLDGKLNQHMAGLELFRKLYSEYPEYESMNVQMKIEELTNDWDGDNIIAAMEMDNGTSDGEDPFN